MVIDTASFHLTKNIEITENIHLLRIPLIIQCEILMNKFDNTLKIDLKSTL